MKQTYEVIGWKGTGIGTATITARTMYEAAELAWKAGVCRPNGITVKSEKGTKKVVNLI